MMLKEVLAMTEIEEMKEYMAVVGKDAFEEKLEERLDGLRERIPGTNIRENVRKVYDRKIPVNYPYGRKVAEHHLKKVGFLSYEEYAQYDQETRNRVVENYVRKWITIGGYEKIYGVLKNFDTELESEDFMEMGREYSEKMEELEKIEKVLDKVEEQWLKDEQYEGMSEEEKEEFDRKAKRTIEGWLEGRG